MKDHRLAALLTWITIWTGAGVAVIVVGLTRQKNTHPYFWAGGILVLVATLPLVLLLIRKVYGSPRRAPSDDGEDKIAAFEADKRRRSRAVDDFRRPYANGLEDAVVPNPRNFHVLHAEYHDRDVTAQVRALVSPFHEIHIRVSPEALGLDDPAEGHRKQLLIQYQADNRIFRRKALDGEVVDIPMAP